MMSNFTLIRIGMRFTRDVELLTLIFVLSGSVMASEFTWETPPISNNWESAANWAGPIGQVPDGDNDTAVVMGANDVDPVLTMDRVIGGLTIGGAADVHTGDGVNNYFLGVSNAGPHSGEITISGGGSQLLVYEQPGFDVDTDTLTTANGGRVALVGGGDVRVDGVMNNGGLIRGTGQVQLGGSAMSTNDGRIIAAGGTLAVNRSSNATIDLDGSSGDGSLEAFFDSTLIINVPTSDLLFDGTLYIENGGEIQINNPWTLNNTPGATLTFGGTTAPGVLSGSSTASIRSQVTIHEGGAILEAPTFFGIGADITLLQGASLQFDNSSTILSPASLNLTNASTSLVINDRLDVGNGSGNFDWDGGSGTTTTTIGPNGILDIEAETIDAFNNRFDSTLSLRGELDVNTNAGQWEMYGQLLVPDNSVTAISGDSILMAGELNIGNGGETTVSAPAIFASTSDVNVGAVLRLEGSSTTFNGGSWSGTGTVAVDSSTIVSAATTINMPSGTFDLDGFFITGTSMTLNAPLTLNVASMDTGDDSYGESMHIGQAGRLNIQFTDPNQSYGIHGNLTLTGSNGGFTSLHLTGADVGLSGSTAVTGDSTFQSRLDLWGGISIAANGELNLQGGSPNTPNRIFDTAVVNGDGELTVRIGSALSVHEDATINVDVDNYGRFEPGINGTGVVLINGNYFQDTAATLGVDIAAVSGADQDWLQTTGLGILNGELEVSTVGSFVPVPGDSYTLTTSGLRLGTFDSFSLDVPSAVHANASLSYTATSTILNILDVTVDGDFNGDLALDCADVDALVAALASGSMGAEFDLNGDTNVDMLDLDRWLADAGELNVGSSFLYGDANLDGVVDGDDFLVWNANKFTATPEWCSGDFNADGNVDGGDFLVWNSNKFTASDVMLSAESVPEPGSGLLVFLSLTAIVLLRS